MTRADRLKDGPSPLFAAQNIAAGACAYINPRDGWVYRAEPDHQGCHGLASRPFVAGEVVTLLYDISGIPDCPKLQIGRRR